MLSNDPLSLSSHISSPRAVALSVLLAAHTSDSTLEELVEQKSDRSIQDARDRALVVELVYGVLRRQETIDWRLMPILGKPLRRLPVMVQMLLRLGAYQLIFLDRIPASAAVDEAVKLAKRYSMKLGRDWSGLVNAVLRNLIRLPEPPYPDPANQRIEGLSVRYALPRWLCQRWFDRLGYHDTEAACRMSSSLPPLTLRVNRRRLTRDQLLARLREGGIAARPTLISPVGVILEKGHLVTALPGFQEGDFYVEDEAAQLVSPLLDPQPGELILDACAAPGGKATHLVDLMEARGKVVALDRKQERLKILRENCQRLGASIILPVLGDARNISDTMRRLNLMDARGKPIQHADRILLDAPCSGLGVLRRHPEAKLRTAPDMFQRHAVLQNEILTAVSAVLRPGGVLVYSTCSTEPEETEEVVDRFCHAHRHWTRESVAPWLPSGALRFMAASGVLSTLGNDCGMDGFYAARLRKAS